MVIFNYYRIFVSFFASILISFFAFQPKPDYLELTKSSTPPPNKPPLAGTINKLGNEKMEFIWYPPQKNCIIASK